MQTTNLLSQLQAASAQPPARPSVQGTAENGGAQFSQALSREMSQRQAAPRAPEQRAPSGAAPAAKQPAPSQPTGGKQGAVQSPAQQASARPNQAEKAQSGGAQATKQETASTEQAESASGADAAGATAAADEASAAAAAEAAVRAAELPATDMLALVAGLNQWQAQSQQPGATDALPAAGAAAPASGLETVLDAGHAALATTAAAVSEHAPGAAALAKDATAGALAPGKDMLPAAEAGEPAQFAAVLRERTESALTTDTRAAVVAPGGPGAAASLAMAQAAGGAASDRIPARIGTPAWDNQISQKVVFMLAGKDQSATLTLNPPDLGPVQVVLNVSNDQASVAFSASQLEVRQALENAMPKLKEMLGESRIALGNATVDAGTPDQRQAQADRETGGARGSRVGAGDATTEAAVQPARLVRTATLPGRVDTFA